MLIGTTSVDAAGKQIEPRFRRALAGETVKDAKTYYRPHDKQKGRVLQSSYSTNLSEMSRVKSA